MSWSFSALFRNSSKPSISIYAAAHDLVFAGINFANPNIEVLKNSCKKVLALLWYR
jgi:hypothetical protein